MVKVEGVVNLKSKWAEMGINVVPFVKLVGRGQIKVEIVVLIQEFSPSGLV
jgi:ribosomal protein L15